MALDGNLTGSGGADGPAPDRSAIVAHELRGPLGVVATVTELLLDHDLSAEDRHLVELVRLAGAQALAIADDLVAEAGLGASRFRVVPAAFDPAETLRTVAHLWSPQFAGRSGRLALQIDAGTPTGIVGDESRVRQILFNLVSNAAKASNGGEIRLAVGPSPSGGVVFTVTDDGDGLAADFTPEPFAEPTRPLPGAGLGLWISCRIAEAVSGRLSLRNAEGGGVVAELALPADLTGRSDAPKRASRSRKAAPVALAPSKAAATRDRSKRVKAPARETTAPKARALASPLAGLGVLVVDDSAISRLLMQTILDSFEMAVETAAAGDEAIDRARARRPDLVILDWSLARETGADVLDRLEAALGPAMPPVVSVSADARAMHGPRVAAHVVKPFTPRELHAALERAVLGAAAAVAAG